MLKTMTLYNFINDYNKTIIWGAGKNFEDSFLGEVKIDYLIDSDCNKWKQKIKDITIFSPDQLFQDNNEKTVILIMSTYWEEIINQIQKMGIIADVTLPWLITPNPFFKNFSKYHFALFAEDAIIKSMCDRYNIDIFHYIDVGANHPYNGNATMLFYLNGACGCLIEPNEKYISTLNLCRPFDKIINAGIAGEKNNKTKRTYYMIENWDCRNTFSKTEAEKYKNLGYFIEEKEVDLISLNTIIESYEKKIDYISIDVEGLEYEILKDFKFDIYNVEFFNIEKGDSRVQYLLENNGYELAAQTISNWVYVKKGLIKEI